MKAPSITLALTEAFNPGNPLMTQDESRAFTIAPRGTSRQNWIFHHPPVPGFLSVIIPVYDDREGLETTLTCLARQTLSPTGFEVIIANDGGDPAISELCRSFAVREVVMKTNRGSYFARNEALAQSRGEFIGLTDADTVPETNWCEVGRELLGAADYVVGLTKVIVSSQRTVCELYQACADFCSSEQQMAQGSSPTVNLFVRRTIFEKYGFFDERLRSSGDIEFAARVLADPTWKSIFSNRLVCGHPPRTYRQFLRKTTRIIYGQCNILCLYPDWRERFGSTFAVSWRRLLPVKRLPRSEYMALTFWERLAVYFFAWHIKFFSFVIQCRYFWEVSRASSTTKTEHLVESRKRRSE